MSSWPPATAGGALALAERYGVGSARSRPSRPGAFGYPLEKAAGVASRVVLDELPRLESVRCIRFVLRDDHALAVHEEALRRALEANLIGYL